MAGDEYPYDRQYPPIDYDLVELSNALSEVFQLEWVARVLEMAGATVPADVVVRVGTAKARLLGVRASLAARKGLAAVLHAADGETAAGGLPKGFEGQSVVPLPDLWDVDK